jgi:predicted dienelactone hydrolase
MRPVDLPDSRRRALLIASLAAPGLGLPGLARASAEPTPLTIDWDWVDDARQRAVPVRLHWPVDAAAAKPGSIPLVVFSHGIGGSRLGYSYLGKHLAGLGWACLHVQHVGSDRSLWFGGSVWNVVGRLRAAAQESEAIERVHDLRFALDRLLDPALQHAGVGSIAERIDPQRIAAAGHSYGANTTMLAIGARVARPGKVIDFQDGRFKAAILISAPPFYGERDLAGILAPVKLPTLHVTTNEDVINIPGYHSGVEDRLAVYDAMPDPRKALVVFERGGHSIFTDRIVSGGYELNQQVKGATKALAAAFLQQQFGQQPQALGQWRQSWQTLLSRTNGEGWS